MADYLSIVLGAFILLAPISGKLGVRFARVDVCTPKAATKRRILHIPCLTSFCPAVFVVEKSASVILLVVIQACLSVCLVSWLVPRLEELRTKSWWLIAIFFLAPRGIQLLLGWDIIQVQFASVLAFCLGEALVIAGQVFAHPEIMLCAGC